MEVASLYAKISVDLTGLERDLKQARAKLNGVSKDLGGVATEGKKADAAMNGLGKMLIGAFSVAAIKRIGKAAYELGVLGAQAERVEATFVRMTGGGGQAAEMLDALKAATMGTRSEMELMNSATTLMALGLGETADDLGNIMRNVEGLGARFGGTMQIFQLMMSNDSLMRIDSFGIGVEEATERIDEFKAAGMEAGEAFDTAILELMTEKFDSLGGNIEDNTTEIERNTAAWMDLKVEAGKFFSDMVGTGNAAVGGITRRLADTLGAINDITGAIDDLPFEKLRLLNLLMGGWDPGLMAGMQDAALNLHAIAAGAKALAEGYRDVGASGPQAAKAIQGFMDVGASAPEATRAIEETTNATLGSAEAWEQYSDAIAGSEQATADYAQAQWEAAEAAAAAGEMARTSFGVDSNQIGRAHV